MNDERIGEKCNPVYGGGTDGKINETDRSVDEWINGRTDGIDRFSDVAGATQLIKPSALLRKRQTLRLSVTPPGSTSSDLNWLAGPYIHPKPSHT